MERRGFFGRFAQAVLGTGAAALSVTQVDAAVPAAPGAAVTISSLSPADVLTWPCMSCDLDNTTPTIIWPSVKFRLSCTHCGRLQSYGLHLKKYDPTPTDYHSDNEFRFSPVRYAQDTRATAERRARRLADRADAYSHPTVKLKREIRTRLLRTRVKLPLPE